MKYTTEDMSMSWSVGSIASNAMLVKGGVMPIANESIQNHCVDECVRIIKNEGLYYVLRPDYETHTVIYIFKYPHLENIINFSLDKPHDKKNMMQWVDWKMEGFSDEEIDRRIKRLSKIARLKNDENDEKVDAFYTKELERDRAAGKRWATRYEKKRKQEKIPITC